MEGALEGSATFQDSADDPLSDLLLQSFREISDSLDSFSLSFSFLARPLVAGTSESDQLDRIFRLLGTPSPQSYPDIVNLPEYSQDLPQYPPPRGGVASLVPTLDPQGLNLLEQMLQYDPAQRISAQGALEHPFFSDLNVGNNTGSSGGGGTGANVAAGR